MYDASQISVATILLSKHQAFMTAAIKVKATNLVVAHQILIVALVFHVSKKHIQMMAFV